MLSTATNRTQFHFIERNRVSKPDEANQVFQALANMQGIKGANLHNLRHYHASVVLQNGASLLLVSKRLGHASVSTTGDIYGHLLPGWQKEAANNFAKAMEEG